LGGRAAPPIRRELREPGGAWAHVLPGARQPFGTPYGAAAVTHVNLNDGVVEGIKLLDRPAFAVQYHPEAAPGPHDAVDLFDQFADLMNGGK
jgi:carbamoylphosphate synthase small subunit